MITFFSPAFVLCVFVVVGPLVALSFLGVWFSLVSSILLLMLIESAEFAGSSFVPGLTVGFCYFLLLIPLLFSPRLRGRIPLRGFVPIF